MTLTITDRIRAAKNIAELRDILRHTTPEEDELIDFAGLPSWGDDPRLCGADSRLYSYHDLCEALGREPSASLRQTLYRARSGDKANGARPWLVEGVHYIRRWRGIAYTEEGVNIARERISRNREKFT